MTVTGPVGIADPAPPSALYRVTLTNAISSRARPRVYYADTLDEARATVALVRPWNNTRPDVLCLPTSTPVPATLRPDHRPHGCSGVCIYAQTGTLCECECGGRDHGVGNQRTRVAEVRPDAFARIPDAPDDDPF